MRLFGSSVIANPRHCERSGAIQQVDETKTGLIRGIILPSCSFFSYAL
ncbi:MAG: hypothetical protein LBT00_11880 [Spirochaetaceae bacterium]|nr:hypothetical protein [Spirochaetaceae bacterium]